MGRDVVPSKRRAAKVEADAEAEAEAEGAVELFAEAEPPRAGRVRLAEGALLLAEVAAETPAVATVGAFAAVRDGSRDGLGGGTTEGVPPATAEAEDVDVSGPLLRDLFEGGGAFSAVVLDTDRCIAVDGAVGEADEAERFARAGDGDAVLAAEGADADDEEAAFFFVVDFFFFFATAAGVMTPPMRSSTPIPSSSELPSSPYRAKLANSAASLCACPPSSSSL